MSYAIPLLALLFSGPVAPMEEPSARPNIIFLLTDDQRDNTFAAMGHPFIKSPNVDRLLSESVRFSNTYIAEPVCSPSRVSYLTGMHERIHGIGFTSSYEMSEEQWAQTYPALLRNAGYHTGFIGKFGVEYYTFRGNAKEKFDYFWGHDGWTKFFPKDHSSPSCTPYHRAESNTITDIMGEAIGEFLEQAPDNKPFCLSVSFNVPHGSQTTSMFHGYEGWHNMARPANENEALQGHQFYDGLYRDRTIKIPLETATDPYRFIPKRIMDQGKGRKNQTYPYNYTIETNTEHHIRYYQAITGLDHTIGALIADLARRGYAENTVIIFGSDHGLLMGEYGMGGKSLLYDLTSKIPCFIHDPRTPEPLKGKEIDLLVSSLDITATILDYADVTAPAFMDGLSLKPIVEGREQVWRNHLFLESLYTGRDTPFQEGIRQGNWKYIRMYDAPKKYKESDIDFRNRTPEFEMLFNLESDPDEMHNLVNDPDKKAILIEMQQMCSAESEELNQRRKAFKDKFNVKGR